jgi:hypothetical protein
MKIGLNVGDRLLALGILPQEGSFITLKMTRGLVDKVGLKPEEITEFEVKEDGGMIRWNSAGMAPKDFEFAEAEVELFKKALKKKDEDGTLRTEMLPIYEKFVG